MEGAGIEGAGMEGAGIEGAGMEGVRIKGVGMEGTLSLSLARRSFTKSRNPRKSCDQSLNGCSFRLLPIFCRKAWHSSFVAVANLSFATGRVMEGAALVGKVAGGAAREIPANGLDRGGAVAADFHFRLLDILTIRLFFRVSSEARKQSPAGAALSPGRLSRSS